MSRTSEAKAVIASTASNIGASERPNTIRKPTARISNAIEILVTQPNITIKDAASQAGLTREHLSKSLKLPHVKAALIDRARQELPLHALQAPGRIAELARTAKSEKVRLEANQDLLNRTTQEDTAPSQVVNIQINL